MKKEVYEKPEIKSEAVEISLLGIDQLSAPTQPIYPEDPGCNYYPYSAASCYDS